MGHKIFNILFVIILSFPCLGFFLNIDKTRSSEKRNLYTIDSLKINSFSNFTESFESYVDDNFEFRNLLLSTNSNIRYRLFNTTVNDKVIVGKNNWLFLNKIGQDNAYADYTHRNLLSEQELRKIKFNIEHRFNYTKSQRIGYYPIIYPNPHTIYSDQLPFAVRQSVIGQESRCEQVISKSEDKSKGITILNPTNFLRQYKDKFLLYLKNDTHWNEMGAYFTYYYLFRKISKKYPSLAPKELSEFDIYWIKELDNPLVEELNSRDDIFNDYKYKGNKSIYCPNGLENLLGINHKSNIRDSLPILISKENFIAKKVVENGGAKTAPKLIIYRNKKVRNGLTALVYRDSYTDAMQKFLIPHFSKIIFTRAHFNRTQIKEHKVDLVIEGRVERYFPNHFKH